jgi:hypothetical protein
MTRTEPRRFSPPWVIKEHAESFSVHDAAGLALGYFYFDDEPQRGSAKKRLSTDGARTLAIWSWIYLAVGSPMPHLFHRQP